MAQTVVSKDDAMAIKKYSAWLAVESPGQSFFMSKLAGKEFKKMGKGDYFSTDPNKPIQILKDLEKDAGEYISYDQFLQLTGTGTVGDSQLEGNEEKIVHYTDGLYIDQLRHGVNCGGRMSRKRTKHAMREQARRLLTTWWPRIYDEGMVCYLAGTRGTGTAQWLHGTSFTGWAGNAFTTPDSAHHLIGSGKGTEDLLAAGDNLDLGDLDEVVYQLKNMDSMMNPLLVNGEETYVYVMHGRAAHHLTTSTTTNDWLDLQKNAGKRGKDNPVFTGALGWYKGLVLQEFSKIPQYDNSDDVEIASNLVLGAQSLVMASGNAGGKFQYNWVEEEEDRKNVQIIDTGTIFGMKKPRFNGKDVGVIVHSVALDEA